MSAKKEKKVAVGCGKGVSCADSFLLDGRGSVYFFCVRHCRTVLLLGWKIRQLPPHGKVFYGMRDRAWKDVFCQHRHSHRLLFLNVFLLLHCVPRGTIDNNDRG